DFSDWLQILGLENDHRVLYVFDRGGLFDAVRESGYFSVIIKSQPDYSAQNGCVFLPLVGLKEKLKVFLLQENSYQMNEREHRFVQQLIHCMKDISANESPSTCFIYADFSISTITFISFQLFSIYRTIFSLTNK